MRLAQSKSDFVSNVSHEIRTPLALISMFSETLEMGRVVSEEKKQEYYRIIRKETQRLTGIVNRILNFSQTEANKKTLSPEVLHVNKEVGDILATYDFHLVNKGFEYSVVQSGDLWVTADREAFVESVINLIDNAMKYSAAVKRIEISLAKVAEFGLVQVRDWGVGIRAADQKHIFEKFYRVSSGNLAKTGGTGLGLSLVQQLMQAQNGKITVVSDVGKGSTFTLHFPLAVKS
jgi:two-component system phosphate regulon sensor histidine kinase PhoR